MVSLIGFLCKYTMYRMLNVRVGELCAEKKGINETVLPWFGYTERIENRMNAKRVFKGGVYEKRSTGLTGLILGTTE